MEEIYGISKTNMDREPGRFELASIQLTDEQKESLEALGRAFKGFTDAIISIIRKLTTIICEVYKSIVNSLKKPKQDFTQKRKPWKKDRFYY